MVTNRDYTFEYVVAGNSYGQITVPKGTRLSHNTALGPDPNYHFVAEFGWIVANYPNIMHMLKWDVEHYGINVPKEYVDYGNG